MSKLDKNFVPYEQALALRELGFGLHTDFLGHYDTITEKLFIGFISFGSGFNSYYLGVPTFSEAFSWFREEYSLVKQPICLGKNKWRVKDQEEIIMEQCLLLQNIHTYNDYSLFEEAELECLKKLIEIAKK